jgi:hypothetical protein
MGRLKRACLVGLVVSIAMNGGLASLRAADARYAKALTPLLDAAAGGKSIGSLAPGAAVMVHGQSGGATNVALTGWLAQGSKTVVAAPERPIVLLTGYSGHTAAGAAKTVNDVAYHAVTIDGWAASDALVDDVQPVWKNAEALYAQKCGTCHALPDINSLEVKQWPAIMKTQASNAALDANETALLTAYLQANTTR